MRQNKGSILKASVEYIRRLRKDAEQARQAREEKLQVEKNYQKLQLKFTVSMANCPSVSLFVCIVYLLVYLCICIGFFFFFD